MHDVLHFPHEGVGGSAIQARKSARTVVAPPAVAIVFDCAFERRSSSRWQLLQVRCSTGGAGGHDGRGRCACATHQKAGFHPYAGTPGPRFDDSAPHLIRATLPFDDCMSKRSLATFDQSRVQR
jgi:hypothetical protein